MNTGSIPLNTQTPYIESNFEIGFLSSIFHTFILIFFAELGDKTFIMLFILQLRTNKVTIFYSALLAEILMNSLACFFGFLINYLLLLLAIFLQNSSLNSLTHYIFFLNLNH